MLRKREREHRVSQMVCTVICDRVYENSSKRGKNFIFHFLQFQLEDIAYPELSNLPRFGAFS